MTIRAKIVVGLCAVVFLLGGYFVYVERYSRGVVAELKTLQEDELALFDAAWQIRWLDEVLTASAARYVQSKADGSWKKRYDDYCAILDKAIATATAKANPDDLRHFTAVDQSNKKLVELETQIFADAKAGKYDEAGAILTGEYNVQKRLYKEGVDKFFSSQQERLQRQMSARLATAGTNRIVATVGLAGIALLICAFGLMLMRSVVTRVGKLTVVTNRLARGQIDGLTVDIAGSDEIAQLAHGMRGVMAAFEVVMAEAQGQRGAPADQPVVAGR